MANPPDTGAGTPAECGRFLPDDGTICSLPAGHDGPHGMASAPIDGFTLHGPIGLVEDQERPLIWIEPREPTDG